MYGTMMLVFGLIWGAAGDWPSFRGEQACGVADGHSLPVSWNGETGDGVKWRTAIPGMGHSCPIVWGDRVFVTTADSGKKKDRLKVGLYGSIAPVTSNPSHRWIVYCLDKETGKVIWEQVLHEGKPRFPRHPKASHANCTPATDGKHLVVFLGTEGLYCLDMNGKKLWKKDLGELDAGYYAVPMARWGFGSSPVIHDGVVYVQCDVNGPSFLAAYDVKDGKELWRTAREEVPTWGSPTVVERKGRTMVLVNGWKHIGGYDAKTGAEIWKMEGGGDIPVPTPIVWEDFVFVTNAHGSMAPVYAISLGAEGDVSLAEGATSNKAVRWSVGRGGAYMQTPLVYGPGLYVCRDNGVLSRYEAKTGARTYQQRLGSGKTGFTASAVAGDGKLYYTSELGDVFVVKAGEDFALLGTNSLGEECLASPAISEGVIYFRTRGGVMAVDGKSRE